MLPCSNRHTIVGNCLQSSQNSCAGLILPPTFPRLTSDRMLSGGGFKVRHGLYSSNGCLSAGAVIQSAAPLPRWDDRFRGSPTSVSDPQEPVDPALSGRPVPALSRRLATNTALRLTATRQPANLRKMSRGDVCRIASILEHRRSKLNR